MLNCKLGTFGIAGARKDPAWPTGCRALPNVIDSMPLRPTAPQTADRGFSNSPSAGCTRVALGRAHKREVQSACGPAVTTTKASNAIDEVLNNQIGGLVQAQRLAERCPSARFCPPRRISWILDTGQILSLRLAKFGPPGI